MKTVFDWLLSRDSNTDSISSLGLLLLRLGAGLIMAFSHGLGKLTTFSERAPEFADPLGFGPTFSLAFAVFAEFFCSLLLALGLFTRAVVVPLLITMAVAFLIIHAEDPFRRKELAILYFTIYTTLFFTGPGKFSLDRFFARKQ